MRISGVTWADFKKLPEDKQQQFLEQFVADYEVVAGLIRDRNIYRDIVRKLQKQLSDNGIKPLTNYDNEIDKHRKE